MHLLNDSEPLDDDDIDYIESKLEKYKNDRSMFSVSELDGFLTAIVSGPRLIRPSEWLPHIWGGEGLDPAWDSTEEFSGFLNRVVRMMNYTAETFSDYQDEFEAICLIKKQEGEEDIKIFDLWCFGYIRAMGINPDEWEELIHEDRTFLIPIVELSENCIASRSKDRSEEDERFLNSIIEDCAVEIYNFWLERRKPQTNPSIRLSDLPLSQASEPKVRTKTKTGPNQPCSCGSGRKYKKCCMNKERDTATDSLPSKRFDANMFAGLVPNADRGESKLANGEDSDEDPKIVDLHDKGYVNEDDNFEIEMSPLSRFLKRDGKTVEICIYRDDDGTWILEFEDEGGGSTIWEGFETDQLAYDFAVDAIDKEGIDSVIVEKEKVAKLHNEGE